MKLKKKNAFTYIDVIVGTALVLIVFFGIFGAYQLGIKVVGQSQARITAIALANQKIEMARNLSYDDVGTIGGIPSGTILETETITRNKIDYTVKTTIIYIDDPFDGLSPADSLSNDYKRVRVKVSWSGQLAGKVVLITDVAPKGVEEELGGGTLYLTVFNAQGLGVAQADIHIVNNKVSPMVDARYQTDAYGDLVLAGALGAEESYQITVTKSGYSQDRTYGEEELDASLKPHASVYEGQLTEISFSIDKVSSMTVQIRGIQGQGYPPLRQVTFTMTGAKIIGQDDEEPVYKYSQSHTVNGAAEINILNLEWDSYSFSVDKEATLLDLIRVESPFGTTTTQPVDLLPATVKEVRLILKAENTFLVRVQDVSTTDPIFGANVRLSNSDLGYDETQPTDEEGETFFIPLQEADYQLAVEVDGYGSSFSAVAVSEDTTITINLTPLP